MTDIKPDLVVTDLPSPAPDNPLEALSWLGDTVEEVAEGLRARGIKGKRGYPRHCPLHNYLAEFGWNYTVVGEILYPIVDGAVAIDGKIEGHKSLLGFVGLFDKGKFPDLIADNG